MSSVWFLAWLVCFQTSVVSFREVPLDLRRNGTTLTVRTRPWLSGQETTKLTDGWIDTCIEARPQEEGGSHIPISVELAECVDITTVDFSVRGSSSQSYYAKLKQPCGGDISTVQELTCEHAVDKSDKYNCPAQVSPAVLKHVVVFVPVGITVCELNIYRSGRAEDPASSAPSIVLSSTTSAAKVLPATGNCMTFAVDVGSTLLVHCNAIGFPFPKYRWQSHHSEYISNLGRVKATTDGSLKLKQLMRSDSGRYECRAINSEGEDKKCIQVNVYVPRPTNIHVVNITEESAVVTWNQPVRSSIQEVLILFANRTTNRTRESRVVNLQHGIEWSATLENLTALTCYTFQIRVNTTKGLKPERISETREFITSGSLVHKLQARVYSRSAVISWKIPSDLCDPVSSYDIQYFKLDGSKAVPVSPPALNKQSVSLSGLTPYIWYRIEVVAIVMSVRTNKASLKFRTKQAAPSPPQDVSIRDVYSRRATVTWLPPLHMNGRLKEYRVFLANVRHVYSTVSRSVLEDTITGLTPNTQYMVWIAAVNAIGMQDLISPLQSVSFRTKREVSSPPRNVSCANVTAHSVVVSWLKPLEVHGTLSKYNVSLLASDNTHTTGVSVGKEDLSVRVEKLFPYTQYDVRVQVGVIRQYSNELLWSDPNSEIVKFTTNQHYPSNPQNLTAPTKGLMARSFQLQWEKPTNPNGNIQFYLIELLESGRSTGKGRWNISHSVSTVNTGSTQEIYAEIPGLSPFTTYKVTVAAVNVENGKKMVGRKSSKISVKTMDEIPVAPSNCLLAHKNDRDIIVNWRPPPPNDYNIVFYHVAYTPWKSQSYSRGVSTETVRLSNLLPYTEYNITVAAVTNNTEMLFGEPCKITARTEIGAPTAPRNVKIPLVHSRKAIVTWSPPVHLNGRLEKYRVFVVTGDLSESQLNISQGYSTVSGIQFCHTIRDLTPNVQYKVWIAAINVDMQELISPLGGPVSFKTDPEAIAIASSTLENVALSDVTPNSVVIRATTVSGTVFQCEAEDTTISTSPAIHDPYKPSISDECAESKTARAVIAVLACLLFVALSGAVYFAIKYISIKNRKSEREMKRTEVASRQDTRHGVREDADCTGEHAMTESGAYSRVKIDRQLAESPDSEPYEIVSLPTEEATGDVQT